MNFQLEIWRQDDRESEGHFETKHVSDVDPEASFLEMLDTLNEDLVAKGGRTVAFDSDCREGICGMCSLVVNGIPHGPNQVTTCQTYMRDFDDGSTIYVEPFRNNAFPVVRDLAVDRSSLDRIIQAGGYISVTTGPQPDPNSQPVTPEVHQTVMDAAICIGCGACVAACPNGAAMLFTGAKLTHLNNLPQGQPERDERSRNMVLQMDEEGFGGCTNFGECSRVCPQNIGIDVIGMLNREYRRSSRTKKQTHPKKMVAQ
ncbi:succinate dehydrogenase/fumarate reductase iron-sulfur subunit [Patulibacter sp. NPDC049589]|uniref:succinate dehydrogenase/fumarate reductase iron-sulfur subunit n=1 Tax=Patulibacter sp. NPDC049589 TaxID=3154731 RepID=UPI0034138ADE